MSQLRLLSKPGIFFEDAWQPLPKGKTSAFLYYLAYQGDWVSRDELVYLFWPDTSETQARSNLRSLLSRSIGKLSYVNLDIERQKIRWQVDSDFASYQQSLSEGNYLQVIENYTGELLSGYSCNDAPEFEHWLELERQEVLEGFKAFAQAQVDNFMIEKNYKDLAHILKAVLDHDPFDEITFRQYLEAVFLSEGQSKAQQVFADYQTALSTEFDTLPDERTVGLMDQLSSGTTQSATAIAIKTKDKVLHNLPIKLTPFIGRKKERDDLAQLLADPVIRLLTIVAPGGMGKTRLAIAVAEEHIGSFADGVWFIPFETLENPDNIVFQIAESLEFKFSGQEDPKQQLFKVLKEKELLLITDNLEHLLEGVAFFSDLLEQSPASKVLATSREILDLRAEHVFELSGLELRSEAVGLFVQSAQQRDKSFELTKDTLDLVNKICERVAGMPLALELAASWLRVLSLEDIVEELEQSIDILEGQSRDRPDRQQSIRTIFDYSWSLLTTQEQVALAKLAVFQGGFDRKAAKEVTDVSVPILLGLSNKSFIRKDTSNRYTQHPLMWQYIREKFETLKDKEIIRKQHATFFMSFLEAQPELDCILETRPILNTIALDFANIKVAWAYAIEYKDESLLDAAALTLLDFFRYENRFNDGDIMFQHAVNGIDSESIIHAKLYFALGLVQGLRGATNETISKLLKSIELSQRHGDEHLETRVLNFLSVHYLVIGQIEKSALTIERCKNLAEKVGNEYFYAWSISKMAINPNISIDKKIDIHQESISLLVQCNGFFALGRVQDNLSGMLSFYKGDHATALDLIQSVIQMERKRGWKSRLTNFLTRQAQAYYDLGLLEEAKYSVQEALILIKDLEQSFLLRVTSDAHLLLAKTERLKGDFHSAKQQLRLALETLEEQHRKDNWYFDNYLSCKGELGKIAILENDLNTAQAYLKQAKHKLEKAESSSEFYALSIFEADLAIALKDAQKAQKHLAKALQIVSDKEQLPDILDTFGYYADTLILMDKKAQAISFLDYVQRHSASRFEAKELARHKFATLGLKEAKAVDFEELIKIVGTSS